ncbi:androgen-induced gene 1 protein isoform X14 [Calonectris borealis]|uniref:androgen-induced gene 1 protein isoform X14 n=1 Tax=Calonectris borealis TaxID=1323832 RepID=UPI003F4C4D6F
MALVPCQVLRAAILLSYCSILCNYKAIDMPAHQTYGGSWKFLTFIDLGRPGEEPAGHRGSGAGWFERRKTRTKPRGCCL